MSDKVIEVRYVMKKVLYRFKLFLFYILVTMLLLVNKVLIRIIPFKKLIMLYSNESELLYYNAVEIKKVNLIHKVLNRLDKILFWKPLCFEQSLTVMVLARLFHLPGTVYFGIKKTQQGEILAHAWSQIGNYWITGYDNKDDFTVVYTMYYVPV